jgi:flagellar biosynthesis/type III secretory pathway M-ring protein FliF/YscJ
MDQLRRIMASINKQLKPTSASFKVAVAAIVLVVLLALYIVAQSAGRAEMQELLPGVAAPDQVAAKNHLDNLGIKNELRGGKLYVASGDAIRAKAVLAESGALPNDKTLMFENLLAKQSWTNSKQQNEQNYLVALQNELSSTIQHFRGVKSAKVIIDVPESVGLGAAVRKPTASATVFTSNGEPMPQSMVDAVAGFISGSRAGLDVTRVRIIDGANHAQRRARTEEDTVSGTYLEQAAKVEAQTREKVLDLLSYIPDVIVAVTAQVDVTRVTAQVQNFLPENKGTVSLDRKTTDSTSSSTETTPSAEPGLGSNVTADINRGNGVAGSRTETNENTTEKENHVGSRSESIVDPKGHPTMVAVSVNVPKGFVAAQKPAPAAGAAAPTAPAPITDADQDFQEIRKTIIASVKPQVRAMTVLANGNTDPKAIEALVDQSISVNLIPDPPRAAPTTLPTGILASFTAGGSNGGGGMLNLGGGLIDKAVLGLLALVAMTMMIMMVKRAGRKTEIPSAEELVGLPPALEAQGDVIGEADEGEMAMPGIEVGEDEMQSQKMLEQVGELVSTSPEAAAKLIGRWINVED